VAGGLVTLLACGDVIPGRGIDQIHAAAPRQRRQPLAGGHLGRISRKFGS
jgi:hypothetical protein